MDLAKINRKQRACLAIGFLLLVVAALFPPWRFSGRGAFGGFSYSGSSYGFLFDPPFGGATLQLSRLLVEWGLIALVTAAMYVALRNSYGSNLQSKEESPSMSRLRRRLAVSGMIAFSLCVVGLTYYGIRRVSRNLPPAEVTKVDGQGRITNYGAMELNAYNGSDLVLTEITVAISVFDAPKPVGKLTPIPDGVEIRPQLSPRFEEVPPAQVVISNRAYRLFPPYGEGLSPQSSGTFTANLGFMLDQGQTWQFTIVAAKGRPE